MSLPTSGIITLEDIAAEFGGAVPHGLQEYYGASGSIPSTGLIGIQDFYGSSAALEYTAFAASTKGNYNGSPGTLQIVDTHPLPGPGEERWAIVSVASLANGSSDHVVSVGDNTALNVLVTQLNNASFDARGSFLAGKFTPETTVEVEYDAPGATWAGGVAVYFLNVPADSSPVVISADSFVASAIKPLNVSSVGASSPCFVGAVSMAQNGSSSLEQVFDLSTGLQDDGFYDANTRENGAHASMSLPAGSPLTIDVPTLPGSARVALATVIELT